ncbi:hypothetical protein [Crateriforma spongiae]|uniref:hypothetical protein n=1 Tax=Crateriforma spongiae TaxID=2724528 RepID=UPI0039B02A6B
MLFFCIPALSDEIEQGLVELHAIDGDTGRGIPGLVFAKENSLAEIWGVPIGKTDENGVLRFVSSPEPGFHYYIANSHDAHKIVSIDEVPSRIVPGEINNHRFVLRSRTMPDGLPPIVTSSSLGEDAIPKPIHKGGSVRFECTVTDMPGFEGAPVRFSFYPDTADQISETQFDLARRIYANGHRVRFAVTDELKWLHQSEGYVDAIDNHPREIQISIERSSKANEGMQLWSFHCRVPSGMKLKQDGYRVYFWGLDRWDLQIADFLQYASTARASISVESWVVVTPHAASVRGGNAVSIADDGSIKINPSKETRSQQLELKFKFDKPATLRRMKLEILPNDRRDNRRLGTDPAKKLLLFELPAYFQSEVSGNRKLEWAHCWSPQDPKSELIGDCIDSLTDTGYEIPPLTNDQDSKELFFTFKEPIEVAGPSELIIVVDSGGSRELDVFNRLRVAFCH